MLDVALIGLGSDWNSRFRPALQNLQKRLRIRGVYSAVGTLAEQAAADFSCAASTGIAALVSRSNIRGILILDPGISLLFPIELAVQLGKPAFIACPGLHEESSRDQIRTGISGSTSLLMPSCEWRYHPATTRLRELLATRLGRPQEIRISVSTGVDHQSAKPADPTAEQPQVNAATTQLWELIDWCRFLLGTPLHSLQALPAPGTEGRQIIHLEFLPSAAGGAAPRASIECPVDPSGSGQFPPTAACRLEVLAAKGSAILSGPAEIAWTNSTEKTRESLEKDRCAAEQMLDHFARRALGGLIPVPGVDDVHLAHDLVSRAEESLRTRRPVLL